MAAGHTNTRKERKATSVCEESPDRARSLTRSPLFSEPLFFSPFLVRYVVSLRPPRSEPPSQNAPTAAANLTLFSPPLRTPPLPSTSAASSSNSISPSSPSIPEDPGTPSTVSVSSARHCDSLTSPPPITRTPSSTSSASYPSNPFSRKIPSVHVSTHPRILATITPHFYDTAPCT